MWGLGCMGQDVGFRGAWGRMWGLGCMGQDVGFRVHGAGCGVQGDIHVCVCVVGEGAAAGEGGAGVA